MSQKDSGKGDSSSGSTLHAPGEGSSASKQCDTSDSAYGTGSASEKGSETKGDSIGSALQAQGESSSASKQGDTRSDSAYAAGSVSERESETKLQNGEVEELKERVLEACKYGKLDVIRELVAGKKVELKNCKAQNPHKDPPLHFAAFHGHKNIIKYLIDEEHFNVESKNYYQNTPLHRAARQGHLKVVKYLVEEKGSNPMAVCVWRRTPLHNACKTGQLEVVKYLMSDPRVERSAKHNSVQQQTPLQLAAEYGTVEVVQYMMENGVDREQPGPYTLLHLAAYGGKLDIVQYLIQKRNYHPMVRVKEGITPLHSACVKAGQLELVKYLVDECEVDESPLDSASKNEEMKEEKNEPGENQNTPLHSAAWGGAMDAVKYFIDERQCNPACRGRKGRTPLHTACYSGKGEVVDYLIDQHSVEVSRKDHDGATPLHLAAKGGHLELVKKLVRNLKCDYSSTDSSGQTPLDYASNANRSTTVKYFILIREITSNKQRKLLEEKLKKHKVSCKSTGAKLGEGSYSVVFELKLDGDPSERLAGKVFKTRRSAMRYENKLTKEIEIMLKLKHHNIVASKGVYFLPDATLPVLVMERLETSLHSYLLDPVNSNLQLKRKAFILLDTARGLGYLHSRTPAIIHRDLTAKNVLLDSLLRAKIADFGNSRIMDLHSASNPGSMTTEPGTLNYMPPEAAGKNVKYGPSLDVFSFGHLSLFTVIQSPVQSLLPHTYTDSNGELRARSEAERREEFMEKANKVLFYGHPLLELIKQCLSNLPTDRPSAEALATRLHAVKTKARVQVNANSDSSQTKTHEDSGLHTSQIQFLLNSTIGIGSTGEESSSNTHSITPNRAAAGPTTARTRDTKGMEDIVAAEQVTAGENTEGQTSFSVPVSSQQALEDRDAGNDSGFQGAQDTNSDSKQKESQEDSGIGSTGEESSSNTHSTTPNRAAAGPTTARTRDTEGMEDIVAAEQVTGLSTAAEGTEVQTSTSVPVSSPQVVEVADSGDDSVPEFPPVIRGADIVAQTTVEITPDQSLSFHWEGHGFRVYIPAGAVSRRVTLCIQASLSGDYQLPDDGGLVSGVYWLSLHPHIKFQKKATLSLQHCASVEGDESLSFITAKCTQETLPYTFKPLPGGAFSTNDGTIQVTSFSGFGLILQGITEILSFVKFYDFRVYYMHKQLNEYEVRITLTPNLELNRTRVMEEYEDKEEDLAFAAKINKDIVSLRIPREKDDWELFALKSLELQKKVVDNYQPGREIPCIPFRVKLRDVENPRPLRAKVYLDGVEQERYITVTRNPAPGAGARNQRQSGDPRVEPGGQSAAHQGHLLGPEDLQDVRSALGPVIARWKPIGLTLGLDTGQLEAVERDKVNCEDCLTEVLTLWLKRNYNTERFGEPSWEMLARAVGHRFGGNDPTLTREIQRRRCE